MCKAPKVPQQSEADKLKAAAHTSFMAAPKEGVRPLASPFAGRRGLGIAALRIGEQFREPQ